MQVQLRKSDYEVSSLDCEWQRNIFRKLSNLSDSFMLWRKADFQWANVWNFVEHIHSFLIMRALRVDKM